MVNQFSLKKKVKDISALHGSGEVNLTLTKRHCGLFGAPQLRQSLCFIELIGKMFM